MAETNNDNHNDMTESDKAPLDYELPTPPSDGEEEDVCRVCRVEGDEEMPLIYPCKCSGSVRYVHADCLKRWLATSGKRACEICDHKYVFTKVYSDHIPSSIPFGVVLRQAVRFVCRMLYRVARVYLATNAWLIILPMANLYSLHCLLWAVDTASPRPKSLMGSMANEAMTANATLASTTLTEDNRAPINDVINHPFRTLVAMMRDSWTRWSAGEENTIFNHIFRGQLLTIALAGLIISIILIREWMTQHNWDNQGPRPEREQPNINPSQWEIRHGVAHLVIPAGVTAEHDKFVHDDEKDFEEAKSSVLLKLQRKQKHLITLEELKAIARNNQNIAKRMDAAFKHPQFAELNTSMTIHDVMIESDIEPLLRRLLTASIITLNDVGDLDRRTHDTEAEDEWVDEDETVEASSTQALVGPSSHASDDVNDLDISDEFHDDRQNSNAGPSSPPPRPCSADMEGFEKEVSYAAPELIGSESAKGKEKALPEDEAQVDQTQPTTAAHDMAASHVDSSSTSTLQPEGDAGPSRNQSSSTQPSQSDDSEGDDLSPLAQDIDLPAENIADPPAAIVDLVVPQEVMDALQAIDDPEPPEDREPDFQDPDDAPLELDDWEGLLEVAGLIGPLHNLFQNLMFGFMIMGAGLTLLIGGPMWIGRVFLAVDYVQASIYFSTLVIKGSRLVLDPALRVTYDIAKEVVVVPALSSIGAFEKIVADSAGLQGTSLPTAGWLDPLVSPSTRTMALDKAGDLFAMIGSVAQEQAGAFYVSKRAWSMRILASDTLSSRMTTVGVGYAVVAGAMVLAAFNPAGSSTNVGQAIYNSIKSQSQFIKLAFFMFIELAVFPVGIGSVILVCTNPLVAGFNWPEAKALIRNVPFGAIFGCWMIGTTFMFWFAALLQKVRKTFRKGVLFFIRDPNERTYNPVKEILDRPTSSQVRKLGISAIMYTFVVVHLLGIWTWAIGRGPLSRLEILPLRLQGYEALSTAPFDLLMLSLVLSPAITKLIPWTYMRRSAERWWRDMISLYNLNSLLRYARTVPAESPTATRIWAALDVLDQVVLGRYQNFTCKARVPASDGLALLKPEERRGRGVFIRLDEDGATTNDEDKMMILRQDRAAREKNRDPKKDYMVVWLPQYWRTRVHALIMTALCAGGLTACTTLIAPLITGRMILDRLLPQPAHDGYNWFVGAFFLYILAHVGVITRNYIIVSRRSTRLRGSTMAARAKRTVVTYARKTISMTILFIVLPMLLGITWELYIAMPIRYGFTTAVPVLHVWEAWSMGMVFVFAYGAYTQEADQALAGRGRRRRGDQAWRIRTLYRHLRVDRLDAVWTSTWCIMAGLSLLIIVPSILSIIPARMNHTDRDQDAFSVIYRISHPVGLVILLLLAFHHAIQDRYAAVRQDLIDAEYVVEERVENYTTTTDGPSGSSEKNPPGDVRDIGQNGFLGNVDTALEDLALTREGEQDDEWEDLDT